MLVNSLNRDKPIRAWPISSKREQQRKSLYVFDSEAFYKALEAVVEARGVSWRRVGLDCGIDSSTFYRMCRGRGINGDTLAAVAAWAGLNTNNFVRKVGRPSHEQRPDEHGQSSIEHEQSRGN